MTRRTPPKPWTLTGWRIVRPLGTLEFSLFLPCGDAHVAAATIFRPSPGKPWRWQIGETKSTSKYFTAVAAARGCEVALRAALRQSLLMLKPGALRR